ncbi:MAG TPA: hypothetical protein PLJ76_05290 [Treponemataceae bacterium]|nr:hypothetical protein [Treponemataceae bacterium]
MTNLDKFYSDAHKSLARADRNGSPTTLAAELQRSFMEWTRSYGNLAENFWTFWLDRYADALGNTDNRGIAIDRLVSLMALLTGSFDDTMDFSNEEWEDIREIVSAEAEDMEMDRLMEIMSVIVSRGVIY